MSHVAYRELSLSPHTAQLRPKKIVCVLENPLKPTFSKFSPNETWHSSEPPSVTALFAAVQPRFISLQNFALSEIADRLQSPTARLGYSIVCTTTGFAQKKDTRPVGGRGISAFSVRFLCQPSFLPR
ncbi:hypothetical protein EMIT0P218_10385 [Pseudomonas sp. IT-P218]